MSTITFTTDFDDGSSYVAAMKGAVLAVNSEVRLLDLTHRLPSQDLLATAWFLLDTLPYFPAGTIHVVVVDPGVGTDRALLCVEREGQIILAPDNGCWTPLIRPGDRLRVWRLEDRRFWRSEVSPTFHGRDILAPAAAYLSLGVAPAELGPEVKDWVRISLPSPTSAGSIVRGQIVLVDSFGNLVTNVSASAVAPGSFVHVRGRALDHWVKSYGHAEPGTLVALMGSTGRLEIAVVNGSAAARLGVGVGEPVEVERPQ